jgi:hypothetical protein
VEAGAVKVILLEDIDLWCENAPMLKRYKKHKKGDLVYMEDADAHEFIRHGLAKEAGKMERARKPMTAAN